MTRVAVIGCGNGGQALAAHLTLKGHDVALYADKEHATTLMSIRVTQEIKLYGVIEGTARIALMTTDIKLALKERTVIYMVLPTFAHEATYIKMLPFLQKEQLVITLASNFSSLAYLRLHEEYQIHPGVILADTPNLPYACRAERPGLVNILAIKHILDIAALPALHTQKIISQIQNHFPSTLAAGQNVLQLGLNMTNGLCHPLVAFFNLGRIGGDNEPFYFYKEGITPEVAQLIELLDEERCDIGRRLGFTMNSLLELMASYYGISYVTVYDFFIKTPVHNAERLCPKSLDTRYITEDIPYVLVPWFTLGTLVNHRSVVMESVIQLASLLMKKNYLKEGRNLSRMGLLNKDIESIKHYITMGLAN